MKISDQILQYEQEIHRNVFVYAYENYNAPPLLDKYNVNQWVGEIFEVSKIKEILHHDLMEDLEELELLDKIQKDCDKFVVFPDVWSAINWPMSIERNQFDTDRRNVVFVNGKVFEMYQEEMVWYWYNHNRKLYFFYKESTAGNIFTPPAGTSPKLEVLDLSDMATVQHKADISGYVSGEGTYVLNLDRDDRVVPDSYVGDALSIQIRSPFLRFDYEHSEEEEHSKPVEITGLYSIGKDAWVQENQFTIRDQVYVHNRNVLFSNTVLVLLKDGSYYIDNLYSNPKGKYITKIDKHSIQFTKNENIKEVIVFLRPYDVPEIRADHVYDEAMRENSQAFLLLGPYKKYTNDLYEKMCKTDMSLEQLIDYGYNYDADILRIIQRTFPSVNPISVQRGTYLSTGKDPGGFRHYHPKFVVVCNNKLERMPLVFLNRRLYCFPMSRRQSYDCEHYLLEPELVIRLLTGVRITDAQKQDVTFLQTWWEDNIDQIFVSYVNYRELKKGEPSRQGKIFRKPIVPSLFLGGAGGKEAEHNSWGYVFVNGCFSGEGNPGERKMIVRHIDRLPLYSVGELNFDKTSYLHTGSIFPEKGITPLYHRVDEESLCLERIWLGGNRESHTILSTDGEIQRTAKSLYVGSTLAFDKYGLCCNQEITILSENYYCSDYMYDYLPDPEVLDGIQLHLFPIDPFDVIRGYDLRIQPSRINPINVGVWNDIVMEDVNIRALFIPNEPERILTAPYQLKSEEDILTEKTMIRYGLPYRGFPIPNPSVWKSELTSLGITWLSDSGTLLPTAPSKATALAAAIGVRNLMELSQSSDILYTYLVANGYRYSVETGAITPIKKEITHKNESASWIKNDVVVLTFNNDVTGGKI